MLKGFQDGTGFGQDKMVVKLVQKIESKGGCGYVPVP